MIIRQAPFGLSLSFFVLTFAGAGAPPPPPPGTQPVQSYPLNTFVNVLDGQWLGIHYASDGNTYFGSSTHDAHHGAAFFKYDPRTGRLTELTDDITKICGEDPNTNPQGKIHSPIAEANGWLYFSTYFGNDATPGAYANYSGSHLIGYKLSTGQFKDFGVILSNYTSYSAVGVDPTGRYVYVFLTGELTGQASYLFRVDTQTGAKANLGQVGSTYNADFDIFVDQNGYVWFSVDSGDSSQGGILQRYNPNTNNIEKYNNELPPLYDAMTGVLAADQSSRHIHWMQGIDSTHAIFSMGYYGGRLYQLDTTKTPGSGQEFTFLTDIGYTDLGLAVASNSKKVFYYQRANRGCGHQGDGQPQSYCRLPANIQIQDFHLLSVSYDPATAFAITDYGLLQDQNGRLVWRLPGMATDGNNKVFMVGDWYNLASDPNSYRSYRYDPHGPYTYLNRGEFIASADVSGAAVLPIVTTTNLPTVSITTPASGNVQGTITVSANASASAPATIAGVQFQVDGVNLGLEVTTAPYQTSWDTTPFPNGSHSLTAIARDSDGGRTTSPAVSVTITNLPPPSSSSAVFLGSDTATIGNWKGVYGADGYAIANDATSYPTYAQAAFSGSSLYTWASGISDVHALQSGSSSNRIASTWFSGSSFTIDLNLTDAATHRVALYGIDWDSTVRAQRIEVLDASSGQVLDTRNLANFSGGQYLIWNLKGHVTIRLTRTAGGNAVVSGLFFGLAGTSALPTVTISTPTAGQTVSGNVTVAASVSSGVVGVQFKLDGANLGLEVTTAPFQILWNSAVNLNGPHTLGAIARDTAGAQAIANPTTVTLNNATSPGASASFVRLDSTTQGTWKGVYGPDGVMIANDTSSTPLYAQVVFNGSNLWTWASGTPDVRALQSGSSGSRTASTWFSGSGFTIDVNLMDGVTHQVALYGVDWDSTVRSQRVDVLDASNDQVLDSRNLANFSGGQYLIWNLRGHVTIRFTRTAGSNAVVSGLFFGAAVP